MKKILSGLLVLAVCVFGLASCGGGEVEYTDALSAAELAGMVNPALRNASDMSEVDDFYVETSMGIDLSKAAQYLVFIQVGGDELDETGIFKAEEESGTDALKAEIEAYLKNKVDTYDTRYYASELPKFEKAEVRVFGKYVVYAALADSDRDAYFTEVETALTK